MNSVNVVESHKILIERSPGTHQEQETISVIAASNISPIPPNT